MRISLLRAGSFSWLLLAVVSSASPAFAGDAVSFRHDVMAVLSKAGCNMGACHGNQNGKGGFRLSLRGEDPARDFAVLTRDQSNRRTNRLDPDRSLILLKATMQVPHEGGKRFEVDSVEYDILKNWIAGQMAGDRADTPRLLRLEVSPPERVLVEPESEVPVEVQAVFSDGSRRDVTRLAVYESDNQLAEISLDGRVRRQGFGETTVLVRYLNRQVPVRLAFVPERPGFAWDGPQPANFIEEHVFAKLRALRINPSPVADDLTFVRRLYLDLLGILPTADGAQAFVQDGDPQKRSRLIDELLERQEFADHWALKWSDLLRNEEKTLDVKGVQHFHAWIRHSIAADKPLDQFARELVAARGSTYAHPQANYYRAMREPFMRAESTAQLFLGIRLQCAKCHNHPFDRWTQDDYYGWANLFARVDYKVLENNRRDRNDQHEFDGEQVVFIKRDGEVNHPQTGKPQPPQVLGDGGERIDSKQDRLLQLADWLTGRDNRRFAQSQVNRIWFQVMGRGIVDPIDDFRDTNPPANPKLLDALTREFVSSGYNLRHMLRLILNSQVYQLSSEPNETNADDRINFSRGVVRRLSAEQMLDALSHAAGVPLEFNGYPPGLRAGELPGVMAVRARERRPSLADQFLNSFGKPPRLQTCECERSDEATLSQTFQMVSGPLINDLLTRQHNRLSRLLESGRSTTEIIETLYWTALTRPPTREELAATTEHLDTSEDRRRALEDVAWALLNSGEFLLRR